MAENPNFDYKKAYLEGSPMMKGDYLNQAGEIRADWTKIYTPGWYITKTDTLLVVPSHTTEPGRVTHYLFFVYNNRNPHEGFSQIVNAPVRQDERF